MQQIFTTCGFCSCGCGLYVIRNENQILGVCPSTNHPVSSGKLCIKGWNGVTNLRNSDRLTVPLVRRNGRLLETSWEEAISEVASQIEEIVEKNGQQSVGIIGSAKITNEECYALVKLARGVIGTPNVDSSCRFYDASATHALIDTIGVGASSISDINSIRDAGAILVVGANVMEQLPHIGSRIEDAATNGCYVIAVDPRTTRLMPHVSTFIQPRPGTDLIWVSALLKTIIDRQLHVSNAVEMPGFEDLRNSLADINVQRSEELCGIESGSISALAEAVAEHSPLLIMFGLGVMQQANSTEIIKGLADIAILLNGSIMPLRGHNNAQGAWDMGLSFEFLPGHAPLSSEPARKVWEAIWNRQLPSEPGLSAVGMLKAAEGGVLKALLIFGENLLLSAPNMEATRKALERVDFLAVADLYLTETAELADVVFPACSFLEKDGTFTNIERRVQPVCKIFEPLGQSKSDLEILSSLAARLGGELSNNPDRIMAEIAMGVPQYRTRPDSWEDLPWGWQWSPGRNGVNLHAVSVSMAEVSDKYPFRLIASRINFHQQTGTMASKNVILAREYPEPFAELCEADAEAIGAKPGGAIRISSERGSLVRTLVLNDSIPRGCVHVPHYFHGDSPNLLASYECDSISQVPVYKGLQVKVEAVK